MSSIVEGAGAQAQRPFVDIIWNITRVCPFKCRKCCVDAAHVEVRRSKVLIRTEGLQQLEELPFDRSRSSMYDQAARHRQQQGLELDFAGKVRVLDHLEGFDAKLDFSGGDPFVVSDTFKVMREAKERGIQITATATGPGLNNVSVREVADLVDELNFTYDGEPPENDANCPRNYANSNLHHVRPFADAGVPVRAECPLTLQNIDEAILEQIFMDLHRAGIGKLLLMRLFPVGRGSGRREQIPTQFQYKKAIDFLRELERQYGSPTLKLQCALKHLDVQGPGPNPCDAVRESFGLMWDGVLLGSPWAINEVGKPLDPIWVLGNLAKQPLREILATEHVKTIRARHGENHGHCMIQAFINGSAPTALERLFEKSDPLYKRTGDTSAA